MNITLIHPPLDDPTVPYHACAYLKGHLNHCGFPDVRIRDLNIEYVNYLLSDETIACVYERVDRRIAQLVKFPSLDCDQQEQLYRLMAGVRHDPERITRAASQLRSPGPFLNFPVYLSNIDVICSYMKQVGALCFPADHDGFMQLAKGRFSLGSSNDIFDAKLGGRVCSEFVRFFEQRLQEDGGLADTDLFGISVIYDHQLMHAFCLARLLKAKWPHKQVAFGGTAISQLFKYLKVKIKIKQIFEFADALVLGEGETALADIVKAGGVLPGATFRNTLTRDSSDETLRSPRIEFEDLRELGPPSYEFPWDLYLSPERGINYSPTRGCYWNRCTFCDYGLNTDQPTSPWRERPVAMVAEDLRQAVNSARVSSVYFAVDVMAPGYLERLSDAMLEGSVLVSWSAELRMERIFSAARIEKMRRSGCVCVSFGMESGNQRVLDLIDKGTKLTAMRDTMRNFTAAGIACQLMAFTDFPTETCTERQTTLDFIRENEPYWSSGGLGTFMLTAGSIIARNPAEFEIDVLDITGADVARSVPFRITGQEGHALTRSEDGDASFADTGTVFPAVLGRPWAGGTDSLHSMIYYRDKGLRFFKDNSPFGSPRVTDLSDKLLHNTTLSLKGRLVRTTIDLKSILRSRVALQGYVQRMFEQLAEPDYSSYLAWVAGVPVLEISEKNGDQFWIVAETNCLRIEQALFGLLEIAQRGRHLLGHLLSGLPPAVRDSLSKQVRQLEAAGLIVLHCNSEPLRSPQAEANLRRVMESGERSRQYSSTTKVPPLVTISGPSGNVSDRGRGGASAAV